MINFNANIYSANQIAATKGM